MVARRVVQGAKCRPESKCHHAVSHVAANKKKCRRQMEDLRILGVASVARDKQTKDLARRSRDRARKVVRRSGSGQLATSGTVEVQPKGPATEE